MLPEGGSFLGTYFGFLRYTALSPGLNSSLLKIKGPEPVVSSICLNASVCATRRGMMNGTLDDGLPRASSTKPQGSRSRMRNSFAEVASMRSTKFISAIPIGSRFPQRASEAATSSPVTALPSWNSRPDRSLNIHSRLSGLTVQVSTICGLIWFFSSVPNSVS